jgi:ABC-type amino acid transport substrate-binding protein
MQTINQLHQYHRESESTDPWPVAQAFLAQHGQPPLETVRALVQRHRVVCLGEIHNYPGRFLLADMVRAAAQAGAETLFVELAAADQAQLDVFMRTGLNADLPESAGGGGAEIFDFQQPYVEMLDAARASGLRLVAIDQPYAPFSARDAIMAENALTNLEACQVQKAVIVVGQLHLLPRPYMHTAKSLATYLRERFAGQVATMGRSFLDPDYAEFCLWSAAAQSDTLPPSVLPAEYSLFANMANSTGNNPLYGNDFDYLFFYPYPHLPRDAVAPPQQ